VSNTPLLRNVVERSSLPTSANSSSYLIHEDQWLVLIMKGKKFTLSIMSEYLAFLRSYDRHCSALLAWMYIEFMTELCPDTKVCCWHGCILSSVSVLSIVFFLHPDFIDQWFEIKENNYYSNCSTLYIIYCILYICTNKSSYVCQILWIKNQSIV